MAEERLGTKYPNNMSAEEFTEVCERVGGVAILGVRAVLGLSPSFDGPAASKDEELVREYIYSEFDRQANKLVQVIEQQVWAWFLEGAAIAALEDMETGTAQ